MRPGTIIANANNSRRDFLRMLSYGIGAAAAPIARPASGRTRFDVRTFGAVADGSVIDTPAINRAVQAASANRGGEVYFPPGHYLCFSIRLRSDIAIVFSPGAVLMAASPGPTGSYDDVHDEPPGVYQDYGHSHWANSLMHGEGLENLLIRGPGLLIGSGLTTAFPSAPSQAEERGVGNKTIALRNCRNVMLNDLTIREGGHFAVLATGTDNLTIDNLRIDTNRDGIDIDCCRDVRIVNCKVNSPFDDAICLKSSYALGRARTTERVTIKNCNVSGYKLGSLIDGRRETQWPSSPWPEDALKPRAPTGRIKVGTESNGGFRDIVISDCTFDNCRGLALETVDGGILENIRIAKIAMRDITAAPFLLRLGSRMRGPSGTPAGIMRRISIYNVTCTNAVAGLSSVISGIPGHDIQDLTISDVHIEHQGGVANTIAASDLPEAEGAYPEAAMFGLVIPSQGFFIRHVRGLRMLRVEVECKQVDTRPVFALRDVDDARFANVKAHIEPGGSIFSLSRVRRLFVSNCTGLKDIQGEHFESATF